MVIEIRIECHINALILKTSNFLIFWWTEDFNMSARVSVSVFKSVCLRLSKVSLVTSFGPCGHAVM